MSKPIIVFFLNVLFVFQFSQAMAEADDVKRITEMVAQQVASGNSQALAEMMPTVETLWQQDRVAYLKAVRQAVSVLRTSTKPAALKAALDTFANVLSKTSPSDPVAAAAYFQLKSEIVGGYLNLAEVRLNKTRMLMIADFLGEIRSQMIPKYRYRGTHQPGMDILVKAGVWKPDDLPSTELKHDYARALKQNEENMKTDKLQHVLIGENETVAFFLKRNAEDMPGKKADNREFFEELAKRAKLTPEEKAEMMLQSHRSDI